jgi:cysteine desulfuration protein SufE
MTDSTDTPLPPPLAEIRDDFLELTQPDRLQLLLEFSNELPALPERLRGHEDELERVEECQSPVFITVTVGADGDAPDVVRMHATAPREAPTTRGFASILAQGLSGLTVDQVLAVPADYPLTLGLSEAVSPLRIRGMVGMLGRVQRQVRAGAGSPAAGSAS